MALTIFLRSLVCLVHGHDWRPVQAHIELRRRWFGFLEFDEIWRPRRICFRCGKAD